MKRRWKSGGKAWEHSSHERMIGGHEVEGGKGDNQFSMFWISSSSS